VNALINRVSQCCIPPTQREAKVSNGHDALRDSGQITHNKPTFAKHTVIHVIHHLNFLLLTEGQMMNVIQVIPENS
jgi:hypothetical protein